MAWLLIAPARWTPRLVVVCAKLSTLEREPAGVASLFPPSLPSLRLSLFPFLFFLSFFRGQERNLHPRHLNQFTRSFDQTSRFDGVYVCVTGEFSELEEHQATETKQNLVFRGACPPLCAVAQAGTTS